MKILLNLALIKTADQPDDRTLRYSSFLDLNTIFDP